MSGSVIDTNVVIKVIANDALADSLLDSLGDTYIPAIVVGELYYGAENSSRREENLATFNEFISQYEILGIDKETAVSYAEIKHGLKKSGINIPENDMWIAATAHRHGMSIATFDAHFSNIPQVTVLPGTHTSIT